MQKIYVQGKPLFLTDRLDGEVEEYLHRQDTIFLDDLSTPAIKTVLQQLEQPEIYTGVFFHPDLNALVNAFKHHLPVIQAAGGMVHTATNEVLLIFRRGKWDLPKGKLDEGESLEACALREIEEETGVGSLTLEQPLGITYHTYTENGRQVLKESHWYLVKAGENTSLTPQAEEDIEQCAWVPVDKLADYLPGAFPSVADVLKSGLQLLEKTK